VEIVYDSLYYLKSFITMYLEEGSKSAYQTKYLIGENAYRRVNTCIKHIKQFLDKYL
jgi:hypothetical protein